MRIGIASPIDISIFAHYFQSKVEQEVIYRNVVNAYASAVHTLIFEFLSKGHFVRIFTLGNEDIHLKSGKLEICIIKSYQKYPIKYLWGDFINAKQISVVMKNNTDDLDVLHAHWTYSYALAASNLTNKLPVFCTVRDWSSIIWKFESLKNKITWSFRYLINEMVFQKRNLHFIANSPYTKALISKKYGLDPIIIPNPIKSSFLIDTNVSKPQKLELLCISSSIDKRKNIKTLLLAFKELIKEFPEAHLSLVGAPFNNENPIIEKWKQEGLLHNISLCGNVEHNRLISYLDQARIYITPSLEETFGNTILEAMARKTIVIAGKTSGAIPHILENGKLGFLCDVKKVEEIVKQIKYVYLNPDLVNKKIELAFEKVKDEYQDSHIVNRHLDCYLEKLNN